MRSYEALANDQAMLQAWIGKYPHARSLSEERLQEVVDFTAQSAANLECYLLFPDSSNRESFLRDSYNLQARAWARIQRLVK